MNTLMIEIGHFKPLQAANNATILVVARDQYSETTLSYETAKDAVSELPTRQALVEFILCQQGFEGIEIEEPDENGNVDLVDAGLWITGYDELIELAAA
jgi:hypothetical protein